MCWQRAYKGVPSRRSFTTDQCRVAEWQSNLQPCPFATLPLCVNFTDQLKDHSPPFALRLLRCVCNAIDLEPLFVQQCDQPTLVAQLHGGQERNGLGGAWRQCARQGL